MKPMEQKEILVSSQAELDSLQKMAQSGLVVDWNYRILPREQGVGVSGIPIRSYQVSREITEPVVWMCPADYTYTDDVGEVIDCTCDEEDYIYVISTSYESMMDTMERRGLHGNPDWILQANLEEELAKLPIHKMIVTKGSKELAERIQSAHPTLQDISDKDYSYEFQDGITALREEEPDREI